MDIKNKLNEIEKNSGVKFRDLAERGSRELCLGVTAEDFLKACLCLHKELDSPVRIFFAEDDTVSRGVYRLYCGFEAAKYGQWVFACLDVPKEKPVFPSLAREIFSASLFEREIYEMFGLEPVGSPDARRLRLHDEVWPAGAYPLRKDFVAGAGRGKASGRYAFKKIEGEGVFEVAVGPVHAGIIGPGHFRFSAAGEPVINLELRLGFTHRGVEKLFEGKTPAEGTRLAERVSGDSVFAHSLAFCDAVEKTAQVELPEKALYERVIFLELERMHNHVIDIGTIALDVGYSFPHAYAQVMKEYLLALNEELTGSRYLKGVCVPGGVSVDLTAQAAARLSGSVDAVMKDFAELKKMLYTNSSFMDRVETTGVLGRKIALDLGVTGPAARASGIDRDLRKDFPGVYAAAGFRAAKETAGDALARLNIRVAEFEESARLVKYFSALLKDGGPRSAGPVEPGEGSALGFCEGWRGPVLYRVRIGARGVIERCKIVDPSFNNWQGLAFAVPGNIIPDFPLCNKSFNLSYSGGDL